MPVAPSSCPRCRARAFVVWETDVRADARYRRWKCRECGHRETTYEVSQEVWERCQHALAVMDRLAVLVQDPHAFQIRRPSKLSVGRQICTDCDHWGPGGCGLSLPEAGGAFAEECAVFVAREVAT